MNIKDIQIGMHVQTKKWKGVVRHIGVLGRVGGQEFCLVKLGR